MIKPSILRNAAMAALLLLAGNAHSAFIDQGTYIQDTVGGLDWLKLTETTGISYDNRNSISYLSTGWRYATRDEVRSLFVDFAGSPSVLNIPDVIYSRSGTTDPTAVAGSEAFLDLFGRTGDYTPSDWYDYTWGLIDEVAGSGNIYAPFVAYDEYYNNAQYIVDLDVAGLGVVSSSYADTTLGHWLVRSNATEASVPVPPALALVLGGLLLMRHRETVRNAHQNA